MNPLEQFKINDKFVKIYYCEDASNPLKDCDTAVTIVHWHSRYDLGERIEYMTEDEIKAIYKENNDPIVCILPLYMYDHSGITVSTKPFGCRFDSGQVGWALMTNSGCHKMGYLFYKPEELVQILNGDIQSFDHYLRGNVYDFTVEDKDGEIIDSCSGYIGELDECIVEIKEQFK